MTRRDLNHAGPTDPDVALMLAFAAGDEEAFVQLYRRYRDRIVSFARRLLGNEAEAEEAAQDVFLKLYGARGRYTPKSAFSTYLFRIATNHCLNVKARLPRKLSTPDAFVDARPDEGHLAADAVVDQVRVQHAVRAAMAALPVNQAAAMALSHYEGLSYRDVAEVLSVSEGAVKSLVHRARQTLAKELAWLMTGKDEVSHAVR